MMATSPMESLSSGFIINIELFFITLLLALPLGLVITFCSMSKFKPLKWLSRTFVWIIRGTPLMLQLFVVLYAPGLLFSMPMNSRFTAAVIAFVINYAAYFSEIYRGGIESVSKGQYEAGQVLGMTKTQIFFKIILLQVIKRIIPPLSNEVITLYKGYFTCTNHWSCRDYYVCGAFYKAGAYLATVFYRSIFPCFPMVSYNFIWMDRKENGYFRV